jgi:hypothetical protein
MDGRLPEGKWIQDHKMVPIEPEISSEDEQRRFK